MVSNYDHKECSFFFFSLVVVVVFVVVVLVLFVCFTLYRITHI